MAHKEVYFEQSHKNSLEREFEDLTENYEQAKSDIYHLEEEKLKLEKETDRLNEMILEK
jgi:predicted  nucleic acid-binding Zn-ribbon protein